MSMLLSGIFLLIIIVPLAMIGRDGMWSNAIALVNVVTAALLAVNLFEPAATYLCEQAPTYVHVFDFLMLWGLFALFYGLMRLATDNISKTRVRFNILVDQLGGMFFSVWVGWVLVCFTAMTLHTAPMTRDYLFDGFKPEKALLFGLAPDRLWLGFSQNMSQGGLSRLADPSDPEKHVFDPKGEFIIKYATRRSIMEKAESIRVP